MKTGRPETNEILVACAAHRTQELQIVDRLEKVRFSLTVLADDEHARRWQLDLDAFEIAKVADGERVEPRRRAGFTLCH